MSTFESITDLHRLLRTRRIAAAMSFLPSPVFFAARPASDSEMRAGRDAVTREVRPAPSDNPMVGCLRPSVTLRELSDVSPPAIHITVPNDFRIRRDVPAHLAVHHAELRDDEVTLFEGIPCTSVARTIEDCHRAHLGPALLRQALQDAEREGFLSPAEAADLRKRVLAARV